jgi:hypothetical protein
MFSSLNEHQVRPGESSDSDASFAAAEFVDFQFEFALMGCQMPEVFPVSLARFGIPHIAKGHDDWLTHRLTSP